MGKSDWQKGDKMKTEFQQEHKDFSDLAHIAARKLIYPFIFNNNNLHFETTDFKDGGISKRYDGEMGIDRIVSVAVGGLRAPLEFAVQERFRTAEYCKYQDMTITEWNGASNIKGELYKIKASIFVYGYFDTNRAAFLDSICINVPSLLMNIAANKIKHERRTNPKQQDFICLKFQDMQNIGCVAWRQLKRL